MVVLTNPFFWAFVDMFGLLGGIALVSGIKLGQNALIGFTTILVCDSARIILVMPFCIQPRFDGWRPFEVWLGDRYLTNSPFAGLMRWGFWRGQEMESWGSGIHFIDAWGFFDQPEPRLDTYRWMAPLFRLFKPMRIFHFQRREGAG